MLRPSSSGRSATRQPSRSSASARGGAPSNPKLDSRTTARSIPPNNKSAKKSSTPSWWPFLDKKTAATKKPAKAANRYNPTNPQDARRNCRACVRQATLASLAPSVMTLLISVDLDPARPVSRS